MMSRSKPRPWTASLAASLMSFGPTVPFSGPMWTATRLLRLPGFGVFPGGVQVEPGEGFEPVEFEPFVFVGVLDAGFFQVFDDHVDEAVY